MIWLLFIPFLSGVATFHPGHGPRMVVDFGSDVLTEQGGFFRCFGGRPDLMTDDLVDLGQPPAGAWRVQIHTAAPTSGIGQIIALFDERNPAEAKPMELAGASALRLRALGVLGERRLRVELVPLLDADSLGVTIGVIEPDQLEPNSWNRIELPFAPAEMPYAGYIRFAAEGEGAAWFAFDWIVLAMPDPRPNKFSDRGPDKPLRTAMWVWHTAEILPDEKRRADLLDFCRRHSITDLFCQLKYEYADGKVELKLVEPMQAFNAAARAQGITVHALDGHREYVLEHNHPRMIALLEAIGRYNDAADEAQRFEAVHLDNEPYTMKDWADPGKRRDIIRQFVDLNRKLRQKADALGLVFGIDIPFWFDAVDDNRQPRFTYSPDDESRPIPLLEALLPTVHNVGIMSYRERVTGPDGIVAHCLNEFELAERLGIEVFASVELGAGPDVEKGITFGVYPLSYFDSQLRTLRRVLAGIPSCAGVAIHYYSQYARLEAAP